MGSVRPTGAERTTCGRRVLRLSEDLMRADSAPDNVGLPLDLLLSILEGCSTIAGPGHLEDGIRSLHALDAKPLAEGFPGL